LFGLYAGVCVGRLKSVVEVLVGKTFFLKPSLIFELDQGLHVLNDVLLKFIMLMGRSLLFRSLFCFKLNHTLGLEPNPTKMT
jgi:hypothetical protein